MNLRHLDKAELKAWADLQTPIMLPENAALYFDVGAATVRLVALDALLSRKDPEADPSSVNRAMVFAQAAAEGRIDKRQPLSVIANEDATFTLLDGTSTLGAARRSGWTHIPVIVAASA